MIEMTVIAISGTPGSGKTTIANLLKKGDREVINIGEFASQNGCVSSYDEMNKCDVIDGDLVIEKLREYLKGKTHTIIVESHLADLVPEEYLDRCYVLEVQISDLVERLKERGYSEKKIADNKLSELMRDCYMYSLDAFGEERVEVIKPSSIEEIVRIIEDYLEQVERGK